MVKKLPTKDELRAQLDRETRRYLDGGGEVTEVPRGVTGADPTKPRSFQSSSQFTQPKASRTYVPEVIAAIDRRQEERRKRRPVRNKRKRLPQPRRRVIYDDFGEPIRKVWVDD